MVWYEELGFEKNPLSTSPSNHLNDLMGLQDILDEVSYRIQAGNMVFVEGDEGLGKSSILRSMIEHFEGQKKVIYIDAAALTKSIDVQKVLQERYGFYGRIFNIIPDDMILLVDNVQRLSRRNGERLKYYFDNNYIRSVVFTGKSFKNSGLSKSIKDRIGGRVVKLKPLSERQASEAIKRRLNDSVSFQPKVLKKIHAYSKGNMRKLLEKCEDILEGAIDSGREAISFAEVNKVLKK